MKVDHMELERILEPLKTEVQNDDHIREKVLPLAREAVRKCAESVKCAHRKEYVAASGLIYEAQDILTEANREFLQSELVKVRSLHLSSMEYLPDHSLQDSQMLSENSEGQYSTPYVQTKSNGQSSSLDSWKKHSMGYYHSTSQMPWSRTFAGSVMSLGRS
jgi:hypothetical protein